MEERSLEMIEVSREGGRRWCRQESGLQILWKKESIFIRLAVIASETREMLRNSKRI